MKNIDQAEKLRLLAQEKLGAKKPVSKTKIITVTSGKGGVGKSNIVINLSLQLLKMGKQVMIFDADLGLANIDILLGVSPNYTLESVLNKQKNLNEIIMSCHEGLQIIPTGSGIKELANMSDIQLQRLIQSFEELDNSLDYLIIDTGAGIHNTVFNFLLASDEIIIVTTSEPTALTDAYAVIKLLMQENSSLKIKVIINMVKSAEQGAKVFEKINNITNNFLNLEIEFLGSILYDENVSKAVRLQKPLLLSYPFTSASKNLVDITMKLVRKTKTEQNSSIKDFLQKLNYYFRREKTINE